MNQDNEAIPEDWYTKSFDRFYEIVYAHRTVDSAKPEVGFAAKTVALRKEQHVLDLCCGNARHMVHLKGFSDSVVGLDFSPDLLKLAVCSLDSSCGLVRADMRAIPFTSCFDVVFSFFTSFGYFVDMDQNRTVMKEVSRVLKPGGTLFLDYFNGAYVRQNLEPRTIRTNGPFEICEARWIDEKAKRVNKNAVIRREGQEVTRSYESVRIYERDELAVMLDEAGLSLDRSYGDYDGSMCTPEKPRLILIASRKNDV